MEVENSCREKFEVENEKLSSDTLPGHLKSSIDSIINREAFIQHDVISKPIPTGGGSYLGDLYEVTIKGNTKNGAKELNIFIKNSIDTCEDISDILSITKAYKNECFVYTELSKIFMQLENDADVPIEERFEIIKGYDESTNQAIIMDNIAKKGYKTLDRMKMIPLKFTELSIQQLAKFHSLSFIMQQKMPDYYERHILNYEHPMLYNEKWQKFCRNLIDSTIDLLSTDYKIKAEALKLTLVQNLHKYLTDNTRTGVLCHGDFRANNIMVKKEKEEVKDVISVDYQLLHYGNPVNDLLYFIHGCTDRNFRKQHMKYLMDLYYDSMTNYLKYFDIDVKDVYPRREFEASVNEREDIGLIIALCWYIFFYAPENNAPNVTEGFDRKMELDDKIVKRIEEFFDELEELGHSKSTLTKGLSSKDRFM